MIFDFKRENFKSTFFIKNPINPPLGFCPHAQTFRCAIPTIGIRACFDSYSKKKIRKWLDKIKPLLRVRLSTDLLYLLVKIILSGKSGCKSFGVY